MKIVAAMDSLKGSLSSLQAGNAVSEGIKRVYPDARVDVRPLADGGEGTVDALVYGMKGEKHRVTVTGPLGRQVECEYGMRMENPTAIIEMSGAAGITLLSEKERNPLFTTTYGVGEVIKDAVTKGCRRFIIGIGGSATNDGGVGMLQALGYEFLDAQNNQVPLGARGLSRLKTISDANALPELAECEFCIACDVTNPLCGPQGCSAVYGPQKGADAPMIAQMDQWLGRYADLTKNKYPKADPWLPGTGAAGGLGFAFLTFTNAVLKPGIQIVLEETRLEDYLKNADLVITGEGRLDNQTSMGKAPVGVAALAKKHDRPVVAFAGSVSRDAVTCNQNGIDAFFPILREVTTLEKAMDTEYAKENMALAAEQVMRLWRVAGTFP